MLRSLFALLAAGGGGFVFGGLALLMGLGSPSDAAQAFNALWFARTVFWGAGVRLRVEGADRIPEGTACFFAGNHQSDLDIPVMMYARRGHVRFMAKASLFRIPVFGWAMARYGHIAINRADVRASAPALERLVERLRNHPVPFVVFPEGTRSDDGRLLPFRAGAMKICQRAGLPVVPFAIDGTLAIHGRRSLRVHPGPVRLIFGAPIPAEEAMSMSSRELAGRVQTEVARLLGQDLKSQSAAPPAADKDA